MGRTPYQRGADKERRIVNKFRKEGCLALRSAGSHSPIDVIVVDDKNKLIRLIQSKMGKSYTRTFKDKLLLSLKYLNGTYAVKAEVWD